MDQVLPHGAAATQRATRKAIAARLIRAREAFEMNQTDFAKRAGIPPNYLTMFEKGDRRIPLTQAIKLKAEYGLSLDWIYFGDMAGMHPDMVLKLSRSNHK